MAKRTRGFLVLGLLVALILAGIVSYYASGSPDGLNKVAADHGFDKSQKDHAGEDSPLAGYATKGVGSDRLSGGIAGVAGVGITLAIGSGLAYAVRRRHAPASMAEEEGGSLADRHS
jgi:cobalt/nickel transport system permease protein